MLLALGLVLASPFMAATLQRRSLLGPPGSTIGLDHWLVLPVATLSLGSGLIHGAVVPAHMAEDVLSGLFFVMVAVFQVAWAPMFASRPQVRIAALGMTVNSVVITAWFVTRTVGLPFGPHPGIPEAMATPDVVVTLFESLIVAGTAALVVPSLRALAGRTTAHVASADLSLVLALIVITMVVSFAMADIAISGGHAPAEQVAAAHVGGMPGPSPADGT